MQERNQKCNCGSGKKYKKCCMEGQQGFHSYMQNTLLIRDTTQFIGETGKARIEITLPSITYKKGDLVEVLGIAYEKETNHVVVQILVKEDETEEAVFSNPGLKTISDLSYFANSLFYF